MTSIQCNKNTNPEVVDRYPAFVVPRLFRFIFLAVDRLNAKAKPQRKVVISTNENEARLTLVREFVLFFAGRVPKNKEA